MFIFMSLFECYQVLSNGLYMFSPWTCEKIDQECIILLLNLSLLLLFIRNTAKITNKIFITINAKKNCIEVIAVKVGNSIINFLMIKSKIEDLSTYCLLIDIMF